MQTPTQIIEVDPADGYSLVVYFADGTFAKYLVEELMELRPYREVSEGQAY